MNGDAAAEDSTDEEAPPLNGHNNVNRDRTDDNESNSAPSSAVSMLQNTKPLLTNGNGSVTVAPTDDSTTPNPSSPKKPRIEAPPLPKPVRDYGRLPQLDNVRRQPRVGDLIAYRQLEIGEDCCPRVSEWKEANVLSYDPLTCVAMLKLEAWALTPLVKPRASFGLVVGVNGDPEYDEDDEDDDEGGWVDENVTIDIRELTELKKVA
ncbi:hypothetical protein M427DRAFT_131478 [Gonapodya prolifera JEL478]|uniref:Coilin tudor domain-containing protein n=1 Tax=Gonapodya prolifera (strain JEL478) TaxID=1344416 RepID=A0A139ATJ0_GONPJ|nr:hypothetical protein M427DRAFT_131478 [Gonapodya prolifera JEL478]|eukprot:KXS20050.1 hypothetical protein M427DRAFT_131478 [Gonapodya prolifera JEL478]